MGLLLTDIVIGASAGLDERRVDGLGELLGLTCLHLSIVRDRTAVIRPVRINVLSVAQDDKRGGKRSLPRLCEVALLADDDTRHFGLARVVENLVVHDGDHVEGLPVCDAVDQDVAMDANSVFRVEYRELVLDGQV